MGAELRQTGTKQGKCAQFVRAAAGRRHDPGVAQTAIEGRDGPSIKVFEFCRRRGGRRLEAGAYWQARHSS
jgi:hypothetical protein